MSNSVFDSFVFPNPKQDRAGVGVGVPANQKLPASEFNSIVQLLTDLRSTLRAGEFRDAMSTLIPSLNTIKIRSRNGRLQVNEGGTGSDGSLRWRYMKGSENASDIRDWIDNDNDLANHDATAGMLAYSAATSDTPNPTGIGRSSVLFVPRTGVYNDQLWKISSTIAHISNVSIGHRWTGEHGNPAGGNEASGFKWTGVEGGTMFQHIGWNRSRLEHLQFNGGDKARFTSRFMVSQTGYNTQHSPSSGNFVIGCQFTSPTLLDETSANFAAGMIAAAEIDGGEVDPFSTKQVSEIYFYDTTFQGCNENGRQGWNFKALQNGNTKDFVFINCVVSYCFKGASAGSGTQVVFGGTASNIGFNRGKDAVAFEFGGNAANISGVQMENGGDGYAARLFFGGQSTTTHLTNNTFSGSTPADDYAVITQGPTILEGCFFEGNSRSASNMNAWTANTVKELGQEVVNDSPARAYRVVSVTGDAKTAASGGPTGTGSGIIDHNVTWDYINPAEANHAKLQGDYSAFGSISVKNNTWGYRTTPLTEVPIYEGSNNVVGAALGKNNSDFAKSSSHRIVAEGNIAGLNGSNFNEPLPDFRGSRNISIRDQVWTDNLPNGITVLRNDGKVYVVRVPFSAITVGNNGRLDLGVFPFFGKILETWTKINTGFSGTGLTGLAAKIGQNGRISPVDDDDSLLKSFSVAATGLFGQANSDLGISLVQTLASTELVRIPYYIVAAGESFTIQFTKTGGSWADLAAGSLDVYLEYKNFTI